MLNFKNTVQDDVRSVAVFYFVHAYMYSYARAQSSTTAVTAMSNLERPKLKKMYVRLWELLTAGCTCQLRALSTQQKTRCFTVKRPLLQNRARS